MIIFKTIRYQNFLSTGNVFTEINLNNTKSTLIIGSNGVGKSSIIDSLFFVLYNKAHRNINKPQLVNSITNKDCLVEIEFSIGSNDYVVRRGIKPNIFEIYKNDKLVNQNAENKDYQKYLEEHILRMNSKTFSQIVLLGKANFVPFMALPAMGRRQVIEDLLDIQVFSIMNTLLKDKINTNKDLINNNEFALNLVQTKIELQKKHAEEFRANNDDIIKTKFRTIEQHDAIIQKSVDELSNISLDRYDDIRGNIEKLSRKIAKDEALEDQLKNKIKGLRKTIEFYSNTASCPTCKQTITDEFKNNVIIEKKDVINEITSGMEVLYRSMNERKEQLGKAKDDADKFTEIIKRQTELQSTIKNSKRIILSLKEEIEQLKAKNKETIENVKNDYQKEIDTLQNERKELTEKSDILNISSGLLKDGGIKSLIIRQYIPIINQLINKYLSAMDFFIQFEIDETFNEKIKSRYRDEFVYSSFSEGEKLRLDLALLFAWRAVTKLRNSSSTNLLILDEIFDSSLDASGTEDFMKILNGLSQDTNVFVISHKTDTLVDKFENVLKFKKVKNFSKLEG